MLAMFLVVAFGGDDDPGPQYSSDWRYVEGHIESAIPLSRPPDVQPP
jgi:hypothetical protein